MRYRKLTRRIIMLISEKVCATCQLPQLEIDCQMLLKVQETWRSSFQLLHTSQLCTFNIIVNNFFVHKQGNDWTVKASNP